MKTSWSTVRHAGFVFAAYAALFTWLFARPLVEGAYLAGTDLYDYYLPIFLSPITVWSTWEASGLPAFADSQNAAFYPLNLLFSRALPSWTAYIVSAYVVAASCTYAYVYNRTRSVLAAAVAGLAYGMSEAMLERLEHLTIVHTIAWLPLIVLAVDRLRGRWNARWVVVGAAAVGCCLLAGHTQPAIYIFYVCGLYALVEGIAGRARPGYYAATFTLFAAGGLLAAVSAVPLLEASQEAVRQTVSFGQFVGHSNSPAQMLSFLAPAITHEGREAPTYVGLAVMVFALLALRDSRRQWPVAFWWIAAVVALMAGAGDATPVTQLLYEVPLYDRFRVVARHLVLAAFGLAVLAGFGVAAVAQGRVRRRHVLAASAMVLAAVAVAVWSIVAAPAGFELDTVPEGAWSLMMPVGALGVQVVLAAATCALAMGFAWKPASRAAGWAIVAILAIDLVHAQPYTLRLSGLQAPVVDAKALEPSVHAEKLRSSLAATHQRLVAPAGVTVDPVVPSAFARLWRVPSAAAYGAIQTQRYTELSSMSTTGAIDRELLADDDAALDLLAVRYVLMNRRDMDASARFERRGVTWAEHRLDVSIGPAECGQRHPRASTLALPPDVSVKAVAIVAALRCAEGVPQGTQVGVLSVVSESGERHDLPLRAGVEIADATVAAAGRQHLAKHEPADVFETAEGDDAYFLRAELPSAMRGARLEFRLDGLAGWLQVQRITAIDQAGASTPVGSPDAYLFNSTRWRIADTFLTSRSSDRVHDETVEGEQEIVVFENRRARPRAWLAREVVPLTAPQMAIAVHHSQLPDGRRFDPATMALVDAGAGTAATYAAGDADVRMEGVEDGRIRVRVGSAAGGLLVLSESYYAGWRARIDDRGVEVSRVNLSLQGVQVPPGEHVVTFEFAPVSLRAGAATSAATLVGLIVLGGWSWGWTRREGRPGAALDDPLYGASSTSAAT